MKYTGLMLVGISIISYCAQPPHPKNRLSYSYDESAQSSSSGSPISKKATSMSSFSPEFDLKDTMIQQLMNFCIRNPKVAPEFVNPHIVKHALERVASATDKSNIEKQNAKP